LRALYGNTVNKVEELTAPEVAVIVAVPFLADAVARPVLEMVATVESDEVHVTELLMSRVVPSPNTAMAENCCVFWDPMLMVGFIGVTCSAVTGDSNTVAVVEPAATPEEAETVTDPIPVAVPIPELFRKTTLAFEVVQVAFPRTLVCPSSYVPTAVNCCVLPFTKDGLGGDTETETSCGSTKNPSQPLKEAARTRTMRNTRSRRQQQRIKRFIALALARPTRRRV